MSEGMNEALIAHCFPGSIARANEVNFRVEDGGTPRGDFSVAQALPNVGSSAYLRERGGKCLCAVFWRENPWCHLLIRSFRRHGVPHRTPAAAEI